MGHPIDAVGAYLRILLELEEEQVPPRRARIVERMGHSWPRVSQVVAKLIRDGLVVTTEARGLALSDLGRDRATAVLRKHRLAELMLVEVIGVGFEDAHAEACRWQHVLSDAAERRIYELLGRPARSPYGNPIPGLQALGVAAPDGGSDQQDRSLAAPDAVGEVTVARIGEGAQRDAALLRALRAAGQNPVSERQET
ncbi:DtxR family transcriptional regulator [Phytohabitans suffuscus]|uniref:DtxR family transcriptional regulator n=1 Tax=Phytohabitans suffuscus TaxID=624315 RepID=A0A6F8YFS9_9ACTN|nr:DtxR family transcriptional regulator [Phytohabitans suffuscus]